MLTADGALGQLGDLPCDRAPVGPREHGVGVAGAQRPDEAGEGAPEQGGGAVQVAVVALEDRQIVDGHGDVGVVAAEHPFLDGERPRIQRPGASGRVAALLDGRQAGQVEPDLQAAGAQHAREHSQRPPVERGRLAQAAARLDDGGQRGDVGGDRRVGRPDQRRAQADGPARVRLGAPVVAARVLDAAQIVGQRRVRVTIAARHQGQRAAIEGERLGIPPLRLAQDAEVVEHTGDVAIARAETVADLRERGPVTAIGGRVLAQRPMDARQRGACADREPRDVRIVRTQVRSDGEDAQRLPLAAGRLAQAIARLQHQPELDQRVRDVGVPGTLDRPITGDREAAGTLGGGQAPVGAERDCPLVGPDGRNQRVVVIGVVAGVVTMLGDGCLRAGIVPSRTGMSPRTRRSVSGGRRFFAPEVIQTSALDCGPAALKCLLEGFGVSVSYGRLREACQTSVDGTSIDALERVALTLGLDAEQVMMPVDHLLIEESEALPALVVVRLPSGITHFVVVWRVHGDWVQVMDPGRGRRWARRASFLRDVYSHSLALPAAAFREWAGSDGFTAPLARRMRALGIDDGGGGSGPMIARALADPGWRPIAALDRAVRAVEELAVAGAVSRGGEARRLVDALAAAPDGDGAPDKPGASAHATATAAPPADDGSEQVTVRGAVLLRVGGATPLDDAKRAELPVELRAAVDEPRVRAGAALWGLLREAGVPWRRLAAGVALAAVGTVIEAVLFRALFDATGPALFAVIIALLASLLLLELPVAWGLRRAGAAIEERFRDLFMRKIPRLGDRYFQSRPVSDMAERAHLVHKLRALPTLAGDILRTVLTIVIVTAALVMLDPRGAPLAVALAAAMLLIPLAAQPAVAERDLRMRNHAGALGRYYLDALQGLVAVRTHGAEPALAREHEDRLREWVRAARAALRAALGAEAVQALVGFGLATWLLADHFARTGAHDAGAGLLAVYWALSLPMLGYELALHVQQVPAQRSLTLRVVEPLGAPEERDDGDPALTRSGAGAPADGDAVSNRVSERTGSARPELVAGGTDPPRVPCR